MNKGEECKTSGCKHGATIGGVILLIIATILTLITLNGIAIFGMFVVGVMLLCHKRIRCGSSACPCCCNDKCETVCETTKEKGKAK